MSQFDDRKDAFENKFAHDAELMFRAEARCCKLFGLWVAEHLGLSGDDAKTYAAGVVAANLEEVGFEDVKRAVRPDLEQKGLQISDHMLDAQLEKCLKEAKRQIFDESKA